MTYTFQSYDVLQCKRGETWLDFSTLRTESDGARAVELVDAGRWEGEPLEFRIRRGFNSVVYPAPAPTQKLVCAWCLEIMREGDDPVSHGICDRCQNEHFPETEANVSQRVRRTVIVSMSVDSSLSRTELHTEIEKNLPGTQIIGTRRTVPGQEMHISEIAGADVMIVIEPDMLAAMETAITALGEITAPPEPPLSLLGAKLKDDLIQSARETFGGRNLDSDLREDR